MKNLKSLFALVPALPLVVLIACGNLATESSDTSSTTESSESETTTAFPSSLAVASPFDYTDDTSGVSSSSLIKTLGSASFVSRYTWATSRISTILASSSPALCDFTPELFITEETDAGCFGPTVVYEGHPDWTTGDPGHTTDSGALPVGDLGIWSETDDDTGHACSVAELNARMEGVRDKSMASLMGMASMICVLNSNGYSLPSSSDLDITTEMNAVGYADVTFNSAVISHEVNAEGDDVYSYSMDVTYAPGSESYDIVAELSHVPTSALDYEGRLSYRINDTADALGNCSSTDVTNHGSLLYDRNSKTEMAVEVRAATVCGHDADIMNDGLVDPTQSWDNKFGLLVANYDPGTLEGNYAYSWQAGEGDGNSRIFNIVVEEDASTSLPTAKAFFGYGDDIATAGFDGTIGGFICNWAGPGSDHTYTENVQYQEISLDSTAAVFVTDASQITYAPVVGCDYDGTGTFTYDSNFDAVVDTGPLVAITNDLLVLNDADGDSLWDEIADSGFTQPSAPDNLD